MTSALRARATRDRDVVLSQASYMTSCALTTASSRLPPAIVATLNPGPFYGLTRLWDTDTSPPPWGQASRTQLPFSDTGR